MAGEESNCSNNADNSFNCIGTTTMTEDMISSPWQGSTNCQFTPPEMNWENPPPYETGNLVDFGGSYVAAEGLRSVMRTEGVYLAPFHNIQASTVSYTPYNIPITADDTPSQPKSVTMDGDAEVTITVPANATVGENLVMGKLTGYEGGGGGCRKKIEDEDCESVNGPPMAVVDRIRACYSHKAVNNKPKCIYTDDTGQYIASAYKQDGSQCGLIDDVRNEDATTGNIVACDPNEQGNWIPRGHRYTTRTGTHTASLTCRTILNVGDTPGGGGDGGWTPANHNTDQCHMNNWDWNTSSLKGLKYRSDFSNVNQSLQQMCEGTISDAQRQIDGHGCEWIPPDPPVGRQVESSCAQREGAGINVCKLKDCSGISDDNTCNNQGGACYWDSNSQTCHSCESPGPSCTETATGNDSNSQDAAACAAVTGIDLNTREVCESKKKTESSTEQACTYTPGAAGWSPNCSKYSQKCNANNAPVCIEVASFEEGGRGGFIDSSGQVRPPACPRYDSSGNDKWRTLLAMQGDSAERGFLFSGIRDGCMSMPGLDAGMTCILQCANGYQFNPPDTDSEAENPQLRCDAGSPDVVLSGTCEKCEDDYTAHNSGSLPYLGAHQYCEIHSERPPCVKEGGQMRKKCSSIGATSGLNHTALDRIDEDICKHSGGEWTPQTGDNENGTCTLLTDWGGGELTSAKCAGNDPTSNIESAECKIDDSTGQPYKSPETCPQGTCNWVMLVDGVVKTVPGGTLMSESITTSVITSSRITTTITHPIFILVGVFVFILLIIFLYSKIKEGWGGSDTQKINTPWFKRLARYFSRVPGARMLN